MFRQSPEFSSEELWGFLLHGAFTFFSSFVQFLNTETELCLKCGWAKCSTLSASLLLWRTTVEVIAPKLFIQHQQYILLIFLRHRMSQNTDHPPLFTFLTILFISSSRYSPRPVLNYLTAGVKYLKRCVMLVMAHKLREIVNVLVFYFFIMLQRKQI